jgi:glucose-6-phosphate 1-dehydrogenase
MFLSLPPNNMEDYINTLGMNKFNKPNVKILIEKPFGDNYESAKRLFNVINSYFKDQNVFLLDHYLCKKFMQNFNNFKLLDANFYKKFNSEYIESININALEAIDIQGRVNFYEQTGALKDFVVNHMMEMLCTVISLPKNLKNEEIIKSRIAACKQLFLINDDTITAQYLGYKDEVNNQASITETFIKIHLRSNDKK